MNIKIKQDVHITTNESGTCQCKNRSGFPTYVQEIKQLGLLNYTYLVKNGQTEYHGANGFQIDGKPMYAVKSTSKPASPKALQQIIAEHQQDKTDFSTLCQQVAEAGVEKWVVDTEAMMCTHYDLAGNTMVAEPIPDK